MAFATSAPTGSEVRSFSIGPLKVQLLNWSTANGDTSGTVTADKLSSAEFILIPGLELTAAPTYSSNQVTLAFTDPGADVDGTLIVLGR